MRFLVLAVVLSIWACVSYSDFLSGPHSRPEFKSGQGTFLNLTHDTEPDANGRPAPYLLLCWFEGSRVAFYADEQAQATVAHLHEGDPVHLEFTLPAVPVDGGTLLGPPTLHKIVALTPADPAAPGDALAVAALPRGLADR